MRIDTGQHMRLDQRMKLAPRMIQSMEILQMPAIALEERIEQELSTNPTLELREVSPDENEVEEERKQEERDANEGERELVVENDSTDSNHADDFERLTNISEEYGESWESNTYETGEYRRPARNDGERDGKMDAMANTAARPDSLTDQLLAQWHLVEVSDDVARAGEYAIGFIDNDGYIRTPRQTLVEQAPPQVRAGLIDEAIDEIQQNIEPVGIGARDLRECLLLQIDASDDDLTTERLIVSDYLKDIETNRLPRIAKATGLSIDEIEQAKNRLKKFHPHPGRLLVEDHVQTITPDAVVEFDDERDEYVAYLCDGRVPSVQINSSYATMGSDKALDRKTREFINTNLRTARWLIEAIQQRNQTLMRVISVVLQAQRDYFDQGPQALRPLPMTVVADQLGIHVATVSRAVSEKYLQTPRGIVPLRMFFSGGTETDSGDEMSWAAIQAKLETIINDEDKSEPLSDDLLVKKLKEQGIEIARRTVAKYRKQLNIPAARQRREY
jgi:RNA polymerase sigma-54 factor